MELRGTARLQTHTAHPSTVSGRCSAGQAPSRCVYSLAGVQYNVPLAGRDAKNAIRSPSEALTPKHERHAARLTSLQRSS